MLKLATSGAIALAMLGAPAMAFEFVGGSAKLGYSGFTDDMDYSKASLDGQVEFGVTPVFGLQADVGVSKFFEVGETAHDLTLHGIFHNGPTAMGVFYGVERIAGDNKDFYGFEIGQDTGAFDVELYLGNGENFDFDGMIGGLSGRYAVNPDFGVGLAYDRADINGLDASKIALKTDFAMQPNVTLGAEIGSFDAEAQGVQGRETYVGVNATMTFGPQQGTTFGKRGILNVIPGL